MKTVSNIKTLVFFLAAFPCFFGEISLAHAANAGSPAMPPASAVPAPPPASTAPAATEQPQAIPLSAPSQPSPSPPPSVVEANAPAAAKSPPGANLNAAENKLSDSVKDVVKKLDRPTDDVTLDDLNSARQAIEKIEILTDLEKHLQELDKIRHERQKDTGMASMIPASALQPSFQTPVQSSIMQDQQPMPAPKPIKEAVDVLRISGGDGHYSAIIKMTGDESKTVRVGDELPDGSSVADIEPTEVVLDHKGVKRTLHVKNVDTVFGNSF